jgi:hypothetical protein
MLDLNSLVCPSQECQAEQNGEIVFRDSMHMTARYVSSIAEVFSQQVD